MSPFEKFSTVLRLEEETGLLFWKRKTGPRCDLSKPAGTVADNGYIVVQAFGKRYKAHRLVWLLHTGDWPNKEIDHINRIKHDNRPSNLRDVTKGENLKNNPFPNGLTASGFRGVYPSSTGRWIARINDRHIGVYDTPQEAAEVRRKVMDHAKV